jgi:hypothetical protein
MPKQKKQLYPKKVQRKNQKFQKNLQFKLIQIQVIKPMQQLNHLRNLMNLRPKNQLKKKMVKNLIHMNFKSSRKMQLGHLLLIKVLLVTQVKMNLLLSLQNLSKLMMKRKRKKSSCKSKLLRQLKLSKILFHQLKQLRELKRGLKSLAKLHHLVELIDLMRMEMKLKRRNQSQSL